MVVALKSRWRVTSEILEKLGKCDYHMRFLSMLKAQLIRPPPALREVHFWCLFPEDVDISLLRTYERLLSPEEQEIVHGAKTQTTKTGRLLSRALMRSTLARYAGGNVEPSSLRFRNNSFGKPQVVWPRLNLHGKLWKPPNLCFNLSHTTSLVACGVTLDSSIGIDVEEKRRQPTSNVMRLARRRFSPKEADWLEQFSNPEEQRQRFMQLWTLKESYVKAVGKGISGLPFKDFSLQLRSSSAARELLGKVMQLPTDQQALSIMLELTGTMSERERPSDTWQFVLFEPSVTHVASVCVEDHKQSDDDNKSRSQYTFQVQKTLPLMFDQHLFEGTLALGISSDGKF